jgi:hypothetical protein
VKINEPIILNRSNASIFSLKNNHLILDFLFLKKSKIKHYYYNMFYFINKENINFYFKIV